MQSPEGLEDTPFSIYCLNMMMKSGLGKIFYIPYDLPSSVHFQMGIRAPKRHLFDRQFCVGLLHIFCKNGPKGRGKIFKFWPMSLPLNHLP